MGRPNSLSLLGRWIGFVATIAGLSGAGWLLAFWVIPFYELSWRGVMLVDDAGNLGAENAPVVAFWAGVLVVLSIVTGYAAQRRALWALWVLAVGLTVFSVLSMFSIGLFVAPFALLTGLSAALLTVGRRLGPGGHPTAT